jgi:hypothetical protein
MGVALVPAITVVWQAVLDQHTCPVCRALNGYVWHIPIGQASPLILEHPMYGIVLDANGSTTHGFKGECRCDLDFDVDAADILARVRIIYDEVMKTLEQPSEMEMESYGSENF